MSEIKVINITNHIDLDRWFIDREYRNVLNQKLDNILGKKAYVLQYNTHVNLMMLEIFECKRLSNLIYGLWHLDNKLISDVIYDLLKD